MRSAYIPPKLCASCKIEFQPKINNGPGHTYCPACRHQQYLEKVRVLENTPRKCKTCGVEFMPRSVTRKGPSYYYCFQHAHEYRRERERERRNNPIVQRIDDDDFDYAPPKPVEPKYSIANVIGVDEETVRIKKLREELAWCYVGRRFPWTYFRLSTSSGCFDGLLVEHDEKRFAVRNGKLLEVA